MQLTRKTFLCTDKQIEIIKALREKYGLKTDTGVFDMALQALQDKASKYGEDLLGIKVDDSPESFAKKAKAKADAKIALKKAEEDAKLQPKIDMCVNLLKGEVETNEAGFKHCRFTSYGRTKADDRSQLIPIKQVDPILLDTMIFNPTKEAVLSHRPDIKKLFSK